MKDNLTNHDCTPEPETMKEMLQQHMRFIFWIKKKKYLVPCRAMKPDLENKHEIAVFISSTGERYLTAFTDSDELGKWPYENDPVVIMTFDDLKLRMLNDPNNIAGIVIDPFSKRLILGQKQIEQVDMLTEGFGIHNVLHSDAMHLSKPQEEMPGLVQALREFFESRSEVYKAYMLMVKEPEDSESRLLFIVDFDGERSEIFPALAKVICKHFTNEVNYEMMKATYKLLNAADSVAGPIYQRCQS